MRKSARSDLEWGYTSIRVSGLKFSVSYVNPPRRTGRWLQRQLAAGQAIGYGAPERLSSMATHIDAKRGNGPPGSEA